MAKRTPAKILIVDDNDLMRALLRGILRNEDYHIIGEARNGVVALEMIKRDKPDLICMDVMMPEMDGLEALQNIKAAYPEIIVVMITGNPSKENVQESIKGGASGFIIKPFNAARVLDTLEHALGAAKLQARLPENAPLPEPASDAEAPVPPPDSGVQEPASDAAAPAADQ